MRAVRLLLLALTGSVLAAAPARAQTAEWDAPSFLSPGHQDDIGAYYIDPDHGEWGLVGIWRMSGNLSLGARAGWIQVESDEGVLVAGADLGRTLSRSGAPVTLEAALGVGASIAEDILLRIPLGVSAGIAFGEPGFRVRPYVHPHIALDVFSGDNATHTDLSFALGAGVDFDLGSDFVLRAGASFGQHDHTTLGIGFAVKTQRGAEVH